MSKSLVVNLIEFACAVLLSVGVGLLLGDLVGVVAGFGAGLVVAALAGFVLVVAYEKGGS